MVGVPMLKAERISRSGPKLSDAQTRNFEAIKYIQNPFLAHALPLPVKKGPGSPPASSVVGAFTP